MTYNTFTVDVDSDGIALVTIDLPGQSMNVWNGELMAEFPKFVDELISNDDIKGAVITSGKKSGFLAGADLNMLGSSAASTTAEAFEQAFALNSTLRKMETGGHTAKEMLKGGAYAKPVACAINGLALGGGLELALACHYRVCADNPKLQLGLPEVQVGLLPGGGGTQRLPRLIGLQAAGMMIMQGKPTNPAAALAQGIVNEVAPADEIVAKAKEWVKANPKAAAPWDKKGYKFPGGAGSMDPRAVPMYMGAAAIALKQSKGNYPAVKAILSCLYEGSMLPIDTALRVESKYFTRLLSGPVARNMIRTLFVNKQAAEKGAARPEGIPPLELKTVGVLGAGLMGSGITHVTAKGGMDVIVLDRSEEDAQKAVDYTKKILDKRVSRGKMTQEKADAFLARIKPTTDYNDLKDVDLIIEAVFENPEVKADVIKKTEAVIGKDVIFASNTSTLPITGLAENSERPDQFIGLHFFSPVEKMPLIEIIPGEKTGDKALAAAFDYNARIRKTPIVVKDVRGFFTNRVFPPYVNEAMLMVTEGVKPALIENAALHLGMPIGPLALTDETTLKLGYDILQSTKAALGDAYVDNGGEAFLDLMVNKLGRSGRRFGKGFYNYDDKGNRLDLWKGMEEHYPLLEDQPSVEEVKERLLYIQLIATAECYDEEVVSDPQSADLGAIFGWGFAPYTGGPISYIDTVGVDSFVRTADSLAQRHGERFSPPRSFRDMADKGETFYKAA
ncbi:3-hydroxyacyl-CoA dehydrogenase NAD-binding domain-containing protein [Sphingorhabdus sp. Alg239-R122]|uniref:3-hydroxyacyl-CoA dehydrogenase NAD-binding domain-containing protein n=1 Tax=Sphingorhabdus sp. Alg239-R122 TaxID=2305989 RepID=UPI0013D9B486|nr:3-hydroxyacyl-CoA dehydrogenase NAD-binding domain-containing protein [Sphingorhabdus sp. Alg239-R122]